MTGAGVWQVIIEGPGDKGRVVRLVSDAMVEQAIAAEQFTDEHARAAYLVALEVDAVAVVKRAGEPLPDGNPRHDA